ncbi:hypothetical protein SAY86_010542 [Trapa natans]|uniref:Uncharacterized protein n=1 Tax=Trapa natans TaxID=22666 RepID=A0AAN7R098_TRANT|nr:hypothetical protein SAY86_010542 [Trapa natans]
MAASRKTRECAQSRTRDNGVPSSRRLRSSSTPEPSRISAAAAPVIVPSGATARPPPASWPPPTSRDPLQRCWVWWVVACPLTSTSPRLCGSETSGARLF